MGGGGKLKMNDANEAHIAASALAAFQLTQAAFAALVRKGILSKTEAEEFLRQATDAIKADGPGARAAELLADALEKLSTFQPTIRR
jgi:hypothetical protein